MSFTLMALLLTLYTYFIDGYQCFGGFSMKAFRNWKPILRLAGPGVIVVCSEWWAVEAMNVAASYLGTVNLAAHSVIQTTANLTFQIPFAASAVVSTRIGNLVGGGRGLSARISCNTSIMLAVALGLSNSIFLILVRNVWGWLLTNDAETVGKLA
jgi:MATE family multidrug resistance protein